MKARLDPLIKGASGSIARSAFSFSFDNSTGETSARLRPFYGPLRNVGGGRHGIMEGEITSQWPEGYSAEAYWKIYADKVTKYWRGRSREEWTQWIDAAKIEKTENQNGRPNTLNGYQLYQQVQSTYYHATGDFIPSPPPGHIPNPVIKIHLPKLTDPQDNTILVNSQGYDLTNAFAFVTTTHGFKSLHRNPRGENNFLNPVVASYSAIPIGEDPSRFQWRPRFWNVIPLSRHYWIRFLKVGEYPTGYYETHGPSRNPNPNES